MTHLVNTGSVKGRKPIPNAVVMSVKHYKKKSVHIINKNVLKKTLLPVMETNPHHH
jgi:NADP-dependent 3-hydroxy acid dehydrogenase YdfG